MAPAAVYGYVPVIISASLHFMTDYDHVKRAVPRMCQKKTYTKIPALSYDENVRTAQANIHHFFFGMFATSSFFLSFGKALSSAMNSSKCSA